MKKEAPNPDIQGFAKSNEHQETRGSDQQMAIQKIEKACRRRRSLRILPKALLLAVVAVFSVNGAGAESAPPAPKDVQQTVEKEITLRKQMQQREDQWAG